MSEKLVKEGLYTKIVYEDDVYSIRSTEVEGIEFGSIYFQKRHIAVNGEINDGLLKILIDRIECSESSAVYDFALRKLKEAMNWLDKTAGRAKE